jgi:UDP-N-acetylmuramyl tripeptide synthase
MSLTHLYLDMEPLANSDGHVQDDALKPGAELKDGKTVVVGCDARAKPLIAKGVHIETSSESLTEDFIEEFRHEQAVQKIYVGDYDAENLLLKNLTAH